MSFQTTESTLHILAKWQRELQMELEGNILPFWLRMEDPVRGGFYGQMTGTGRLNIDAVRGNILNARILWTFSAAYQFSRQPCYLEAAHRAYQYINTYFIDPKYGGTFWSVEANGQPHDTRKQFYALAFTLYGLVEYYKITDRQDVLLQAVDLFHCIEMHSWEPQYGGYIEATRQDWTPIADMRLSELDQNFPKSQNTHLHILEAYTNLCRVWPTKELKLALRKLILIFLERIINPETHRLELFFQLDWTRGGDQLESYGHDIECSWLLHEALEVLGDKDLLAQAIPTIQAMAESSRKGLNADGSMTHEANVTRHTTDPDRHWWVQAETVIGFFNLYQHFGDKTALKASYRCSNYIHRNLIDRVGGEWWWSCNAEGTPNTTDDKAGFWKCPYHNSRMCLEMMQRIDSVLLKEKA